MIQQTQPSRSQQLKMFISIGKQMAASYVGWTIIISLVVGLLVGLFFAWMVWPVNWTGTRPFLLSEQYQRVFLQDAADSFVGGNKSIETIAQELGDGWTKQEVLAKLDTFIQQGGTGTDRLAALRSQLAEFPGEVGPVAPPAGAGGAISPLLIVFVLLVVVVLGILLVMRLRGEQPPPAPIAISGIESTTTETVTEATVTQPVVMPPVSRAAGGARPVEKTKWAGETQAPLAQYVTTYALGDDHYDPSFSIETPTGDFLGECGVGISETIGVGSPEKVTALEVWLFDKNDIRTVTKVLMSEHAFNDPSLRAKLAPKGEAVLIRKGEVYTLETQTLKVNTRIDDVAYGSGGLPSNSFFQQVSIELAAWSAPQA
jgi:hypothetical protein